MCSGCPKSPIVNARPWLDSAYVLGCIVKTQRGTGRNCTKKFGSSPFVNSHWSTASPHLRRWPAKVCRKLEIPLPGLGLHLVKILSGANAFEISDIEEEETEGPNQAIAM